MTATQNFSAVAALISASELRYAAAQGANASTSRIVTEVSMMNDAHSILEAFGLACADDKAAMVAAQVFMIAYIKDDTFNLPAVMMEAQMKITKLSATKVYGIANETLRFNLDAPAIETIAEEKKEPGKRGRARNTTAWEIAEKTFDEAVAQVPEMMFNTMVEIIETVLAQNEIEMTGANFVLKFEEQKNIKLGRGKRGRAARKVEEMA